MHEKMANNQKKTKIITLLCSFQLVDSNEYRHDAMSDNVPFFFSFSQFIRLKIYAVWLAYLLLSNIDVSNECMCAVSDGVNVDVLSFLICTRDRLPRAYIIIYSLIEVTIVLETKTQIYTDDVLHFKCSFEYS